MLQGIHDRGLKGTLNTSDEVLPKMDAQLTKAIHPHLEFWGKSTAESRAIDQVFPLVEVLDDPPLRPPRSAWLALPFLGGLPCELEKSSGF